MSKDERCVGLCYVGRHINKQKFVLLKFAVDELRGFRVLVGPIVTVPDHEMKAAGISKVMSLLRETPVVRSNELLTEKRQAAAKLSKLKSNHELVEVQLLENRGEKLMILPLHAARGLRFGRSPDEIREFPLPISNDEFMARLSEAFEIAT
jgi:hypothetical protein